MNKKKKNYKFKNIGKTSYCINMKKKFSITRIGEICLMCILSIIKYKYFILKNINMYFILLFCDSADGRRGMNLAAVPTKSDSNNK